MVDEDIGGGRLNRSDGWIIARWLSSSECGEEEE